MDCIICGFTLEWIQIFGDSIFSGYIISGFISEWIALFRDTYWSGFALLRIEF